MGAVVVTESGGVVNTLGTLQISILASVYKKPVYIAAGIEISALFLFVRKLQIRTHLSFETDRFGREWEWIESTETRQAGSALCQSFCIYIVMIFMKCSTLVQSVIIHLHNTLPYCLQVYVHRLCLSIDLGILDPSSVGEELMKLYA